MRLSREGDGRGDDAYSATELDGAAWQQPTATAPGPAVRRFGPGVPPAAAAVWHGATAPQPPQPPRSRWLWLRRYGPALAVLTAVAAYLLWLYGGPRVSVTGVEVSVASQPGCGQRADVVGLIRTDGRPGTIVYRWLRSDGTDSPEMTERVTRGQREAEVHLLWQFEGEGRMDATAELRVTSPARHTASASFTYACPREARD
jgi:hypothetical protein